MTSWLREPGPTQDSKESTGGDTTVGYAFCTVFDKNYASRALTMARSLLLQAPQSKLYAICADKESFEAFKLIRDYRIIPLELEVSLGESLSQLRRSRSHTELMWTLSSYSFDVVFESFHEVDLITYVDADIYFLGNPIPIVEEFASSSAGAMITRHAYSSRLSRLETKFGEFNVQFIPMKRGTGAQIRARWKDQCTEWCFARHENGQFGDQKYLNEWPKLWGRRVLVWPRADRFQGPWNAEDFDVCEAVTFHFSSLAAISRHKMQIARRGYVIPRPHLVLAYLPYLQRLKEAEEELQQMGLLVDRMAHFRLVLPLGHNILWHV